MQKESTSEIRLDKWLWAARFYKTRSLAATAVKGGKVKVNGSRSKPSRMVTAGDCLHIERGDISFDITIVAVSEKRGPAKQAILLYSESDESIQRRTDAIEAKRIERRVATDYGGRPDKKSRRNLRRLRDKF
jgi:ribosome-associated heat shock protein Hsp15